MEIYLYFVSRYIEARVIFVSQLFKKITVKHIQILCLGSRHEICIVFLQLTEICLCPPHTLLTYTCRGISVKLII